MPDAINIDLTQWKHLPEGYEIVRELLPGKSVLATTWGRRKVVLKLLDADCLSQTAAPPKLHPNIYDRLSRVRELAQGRVANLYGVEHHSGLVYLVWEFCEGETLGDWANRKEVSTRNLVLAARELILIIESLHARGIVHGAIHERNVIVDIRGTLKLTHVSPLLYSDPQQDMLAAAQLFTELARKRGEANSPLDHLASEAQEPDATLHSMGTRASNLIDLRRDVESDMAEQIADMRRRRLSRIAATVVLLIGALSFFGLQKYSHRWSSRKPHPPEASVEAMQ